MKKSIKLICLLLCILILTGCGKSVSFDEASLIFDALKDKNIVNDSFEYVTTCDIKDCAFWLDGCFYETNTYYVYKNANDEKIAVNYKGSDTGNVNFGCIGKETKHCLYSKNKYYAKIYSAKYNYMYNSNDSQFICNSLEYDAKSENKIEVERINYLFFHKNKVNSNINK
jgi:hypothetical protein